MRWSRQTVYGAHTLFSDNIKIIVGTELYRQTVCIPIKTRTLVHRSLLICYKRDVMLSLSVQNQANVIVTCNSNKNNMSSADFFLPSMLSIKDYMYIIHYENTPIQIY